MTCCTIIDSPYRSTKSPNIKRAVGWVNTKEGPPEWVLEKKRRPSTSADEQINRQYKELRTYQGCPHKLNASQSPQTKYPVLRLGHAGVRVLRVGLELALTGLRKQTRLIPISQLKGRLLR